MVGAESNLALEELLDAVVEALTADLTDDDAAILAVQWPS
jgi:hypothetical protein